MSAVSRESPPFPAAGGSQDVFQSRAAKVPLPLIERANGVYLYDSDGRDYMDLSSGPVVSNIGHGNTAVADAMAHQAKTLDYVFYRVARHRPNIELSERIAELAGPGFERVCFSSGGSEAIEVAIKFLRAEAVAFGETQRRHIISCMPSYHGATVTTLGLAGDHDLETFLDGFGGVSPKIPAPMSYRLPENHDVESNVRRCAQALEDKIIELGPDNVLAFFFEPVGGVATGCLVPPPSWFRAIRDICTRHGVALVFDEVLCGTGRTGQFLAAHHWPDALPDVVVMAKGLASGYAPLAATLISAERVERLSMRTGFNFTHTYAANPLGCAVGLAVLDEYQRLELVARARERGEYLRRKLEVLMRDSPIVGDVRGLGLLMGMELVANKDSKAMFVKGVIASDVVRACGLDNGLMIYTRRTNGSRYGDWIIVSPPLTVTEDECDEMVARLARTLSDAAPILLAG